jgi:hypothetical protein
MTTIFTIESEKITRLVRKPRFRGHRTEGSRAENCRACEAANRIAGQAYYINIFDPAGWEKAEK